MIRRCSGFRLAKRSLGAIVAFARRLIWRGTERGEDQPGDPGEPPLGAANILRGSIDAADYKHCIFGLLFYKRLCDVWEEEYEHRLAKYRANKAHLRERNHGPAFWSLVRSHMLDFERRKAGLEGHEHLMGFTKIDPGGGSPFKEIGRLLRPSLR